MTPQRASLLGEVEGLPVHEVAIRSDAGAEARVMSWGAVVRDLLVPTPQGPQRVVLGLHELDHYIEHSPHFGAIAGRFANRIAQGRFTLDGEAHQLPLNQDGRHSLHGGGHGFGKRPWQLSAFDRRSVTLTLVSPDGDDGYPGMLHLACTYRLLEPATLRVELTATTDRATPVNLCHHSYFNLDGGPNILDHTLHVAADFWTPAADDDLIPTGEIAALAGTPYDFRVPRDLHNEDPETGGRTYVDHNFVLRRTLLEPSGIPGLPLAHAAILASDRSSLALDLWTTEPGLQVYDGFKLGPPQGPPMPGLHGAVYGRNAGLCLEPQHFPDSPNRAHFPSAILRPGGVYRQVTEYRFS